MTLSRVCETSMVNYEVFGNKFSSGSNEALTAAQVLHASVPDKTSILFRNVVACRSTVNQETGSTRIINEIAMFVCKGPFTSVDFIKMMQYDRSMSNNHWVKYFQSFVPFADREKKEK